MANKIVLALFFLVSTTSFVCAQTQEQWVARYDNNTNDDRAAAIAVDAAGNVYVTGRSFDSSSDYDYVTIKYDPMGQKKWVARYNGPGNGGDGATAIAVDAAGNVYVTGWSWGGLATDFDYATIKYDGTDGHELWVARYNGPGNYEDKAAAITLDAVGNVYVTGVSWGIDSASDYATIKYDGTDGRELWVARYNSPFNFFDEAKGIAVDSAGNVSVTGWSWTGLFTGPDYTTIKYDTNGTQLWVTNYNGPGSLGDYAAAIAVDAVGNVYVTGSSTGEFLNSDYATIKYDGKDGRQVWVARYNGPASLDDSATGIALDAAGNVYVTGSSSAEFLNSDYATIKYDGTNGNELWVARYNGPASFDDSATAIAVDAAGNVYVTGSSTTKLFESSDYATIKYDGANGNELWVARYRAPGGGSANQATAIAVDAAGNAYVTGESFRRVDFCIFCNDYATIKYYAYNGPPRRLVLLLHGIGENGGEFEKLQEFAENLRARLDPNRFIVDAGFDFGDCANNVLCSTDCSISNGGSRLAAYIRDRNPAGQIILIGYSMGGLIARDLILNDYDHVIRDHGVAALITLGTPHLGYPYWPPVDNAFLCPSLLREMLGDFLNPPEAIPWCDRTTANCQTWSDGITTVTLSNYLYQLNRRWASDELLYHPSLWMAASGTFCTAINIRPTIPFGPTMGCGALYRANDGVVCDQSARAIMQVRNAPNFELSMPHANHSHTDNPWARLINVFCPDWPLGLVPLLNPGSDLVQEIALLINGLPQ